MSETRSAYKGTTINLELYDSDAPSGVAISSVDRVLVLQAKEICYWTTAITETSPGTWQITINTSGVKYDGTYTDRWVINGGFEYIDKTFTLTEANSNATKSGNFSYFSKDLTYNYMSDGDLYRIYDNGSIVAKMESVIMTIKGSLYNEPGHGTNLYRYLFSMSPTVADDIRTELETQLPLQIPQIKIKKIVVTPADYNSYNVLIEFYTVVSATPNQPLSMSTVVSIDQVIS